MRVALVIFSPIAKLAIRNSTNIPLNHDQLRGPLRDTNSCWDGTPFAVVTTVVREWLVGEGTSNVMGRNGVGVPALSFEMEGKCFQQSKWH